MYLFSLPVPSRLSFDIDPTSCCLYLLRLVCMSVTNFGKLSALTSSNISTTPFSLFFFWNSNYGCIKPFCIVPQLLDTLFCFTFYPLTLCTLCFSLCDLLPSFQVQILFLAVSSLLMSWWKTSSSLLASFSLLALPFHFFFLFLCWNYPSDLALQSNFSIRASNVLFIFIQKFLSKSFNICVTLSLVLVIDISLQNVFPCLFGCLTAFQWKPDILCGTLDIEINIFMLGNKHPF